MTHRTILRIGTVLVGSWLLAGCGFGPPDNTYQPPPPPKVTVAKPVQQAVTLYVEENGETEVVERAEVRARVRGFLQEIKFEPGQEVQEEDVLYVIEQSEYQAALNSANAQFESAGAAMQVAEAQVGVVNVELTRAELDFKRFEALLAKDAATKSQYDVALAARDAAQATLAAATAQAAAAKADRDRAAADVERAQLDLDYTLVKAPISGRITKTELKRGNLIENGTLLATVVDRRRMYANFNLNDRALLRLQQATHAAGEKADERYRQAPVFLRRELDEGYPFEGQLNYVDQEGVDQATGTFALRAIFENPDGRILPGLFVRVRVPIGRREGALLVPERGVFRDQTGSFVLTVDADNKVERRPVSTGPSYDGMVVLESGISPDERVLLDGGQRARPGIEVDPTEVTLPGIPLQSGENVDQPVESGGASAPSSEESIERPELPR